MNVDRPFRIASLFSGGGGLDLGVHRAVRNARTVVFVEREAYACEVLAARMEEGALAPAPIWTDVTTFDGRPWRGVVDCLVGGSPCQDLSVAGKRAGLDGERSGLFWQYVRILEEIRPAEFLWENVGGAISALPRVFAAFEAAGYRGVAVKLRASDVGATHQRARIFVYGRQVADRDRDRLEVERSGGLLDGVGSAQRNDLDRRGRPLELADSGDARREGRERAGAPCEGEGSPRSAPERGRPEWPPGPGGDWSGIPARFYPAQPKVRLLADGLAGRLEQSVWADRLRMLGNGCVPKQVAEAWRFLRAATEAD